jgi:hypothetical protein
VLRSYYEVGKFRPDARHGARIGFAKLEKRWECLHSFMAKRGGSDSKLNADSAMGHSFVSFIEDYVRIKVRSVKGSSSGLDSFAALLSHSGLSKPETKDPRQNRLTGTLESGSLSQHRRVRSGRIMCRGCGMQFIPKGETCTVCYNKAHGLGRTLDRIGGATPTPKKGPFR